MAQSMRATLQGLPEARHPDQTGVVTFPGTARGEVFGDIFIHWYSWGDRDRHPTVLLLHVRRAGPCWSGGGAERG